MINIRLMQRRKKRGQKIYGKRRREKGKRRERRWSDLSSNPLPIATQDLVRPQECSELTHVLLPPYPIVANW